MCPNVAEWHCCYRSDDRGSVRRERGSDGGARITIAISGLRLEYGTELKRDALDELERGTRIGAELIPTPGNAAKQPHNLGKEHPQN
jgi:hypothetical protein